MKKLTRRPTRFDGLTLGLDVHKRVIQWCLLDRQGDEVDNEQIRASRKAVRSLIVRLQDLGPLQVSLEATGCFLWIYDLLVEVLGRERVHVAAPGRVRVIAESGEKTDDRDAWWLAYLLFDGRLPKAFVAEGDLRELRIASRELRSITEERSNLMRRMKSHLAQLGLSFSSSDWHSMVGWRRIDQLIDSIPKGMRRQAIERLWQRIQSATEERAYWMEQVETLSKRFDEIALIEQQIPGFGRTLSPIPWCELACPTRFRAANAYAKATGSTPGYRVSAGRRKNKKITREGNAHVRWALTRAVIACLRAKRGPGLVVGNWVRARLRRESKKKAIVAAARKLAEAIWRLFNLGEAFDVTRAFGGTSR
jgi:transposase